MNYFGHERNVRAVRAHLPSVLLFLGPESVGKWTLAELIRWEWKFKNADVLRIKRLTQENARFIASWAAGRPQGWAKLVIVHLDKKATKGAQNALLKTLEEAPNVIFILVAEEMPLETIRSRAVLYPFGLLTEENVADILKYKKNFGDARAEELAKLSKGQVKRALNHARTQESKMVVLRALDAVNRKDAHALEDLTNWWQEEHTDLLIQWCYEHLTKKWKTFDSGEVGIQGTKVPLRILMSVKEDLRPRLVIRSALASVLQEQK